MTTQDPTTWLTGIHAVASALDNDPQRVLELLVEEGGRNRRAHELAEKARALGIEVHRRPDRALQSVSTGRPHQGLAARYRVPAPLTDAELIERVDAAGANALVLALDQVQDPGNLGACLRSASAFGVTAVMVPKSRSAPLTPVARKAAAGGAESVPIAQIPNLRRGLELLKSAGLWAVGTAADATMDVWEADFSQPTVLVLGGEEKGLRRLTRETCDQLARIPMQGPVSSLNVSVACGIALFEATRQREVIK